MEVKMFDGRREDVGEAARKVAGAIIGEEPLGPDSHNVG
jgi:hypothetical protein